MSTWMDLGLEEKTRLILERYRYTAPHSGCAFVNGYQLAIDFAELYPEDTRQLGRPIGGAGIGQQTSLAQYLAHQLVTRIKSGEIKNVEMGYISTRHLHDLSYNHEDHLIHASSRQPIDIAVFRLI